MRERMLDLAIDPMGIIDLDGSVLYATRAAARVFGYDPAALEGTQILSYIHPDDLEASRSAMAVAASEPGVHEPLEVRARHADGHWLHVEVRANSQLADPLIGGLILEVRDITERRLADERFRLAFEHAPTGMALVLPDGRWMQVNESLCRILGHPAASLLGSAADDLVHPDDRAAAAALRAEAVGGAAEAGEAEQRWLHADGREVWANVSLSTVRGADGVAQYCILQLEDVTERRRLSAELDRRARHDDLTGLPNRGEALSRLRRFRHELGERWFGVLFLDLDGFKAINDELGHAAGDAALVAVAGRLRAAIRTTDEAARLAGDEFVVCCGDVGGTEEEAHATLAAVAERALDAVRAEPRLSASIGAVVARADGCDAEQLVAQADHAMYTAKAAGGGRTAVVTFRSAAPA